MSDYRWYAWVKVRDQDPNHYGGEFLITQRVEISGTGGRVIKEFRLSDGRVIKQQPVRGRVEYTVFHTDMRRAKDHEVVDIRVYQGSRKTAQKTG